MADNPYPNKVVFGGETVIDLTGDTVAADKLVAGYTAHDATGKQITGDIFTVSQGHLTFSEASVNGTNIEFGAGPVSGVVGRLIGENSKFYMQVPGSEFGDVTAADVASGKTFTSSSGLKVTGKVQVVESGKSLLAPSSTLPQDGTSYDAVMIPVEIGQTYGYLLRNGSTVAAHSKYEYFGDAAASDVLSGKTFTSSAGLNATGSIPSKTAATYTPGTADQTISSGQYLSGAQTIKGDANLVAGNIKSGVSIFGVAGTYKGSGGSSSGVQAQHITSSSASITISGSGTVKVWGYGAAKSSYTTTIYAFVGDGYYRGSSYGTPTKTSASFSISNGTLRGLPSDLTALDVLVTIGI